MKVNVPVPDFLDSIHKYQLEILRKFDSQVGRFFLLCWHRRARKTTLLLNILIREACSHPNSVYGYIAPTYTQAKAIIWRDPNMLDRYLPKGFVKRKNESELFVEFNNNSVLVIKGADHPDSIRGLDFCGVGIDEWAVMKQEIWEEIIRPVIAQDIDRWAIFAFTPKGQNHAYEYWERAAMQDEWYRSFLPVSVSNLLPPDEVEKARQEMPDNLFEQEFECSFLASEENTLIPITLIEALKKIHFYDTIIGEVIAVDPAMGGDECVIYVMRNNRIIDSKFMHERDTMKVAGEIMVLSYKYNIPNIAIDTIGIGKGIGDRLKELHRHVIPIVSSESATSKDHFYNRRAEMWWYLMQRITDKEIPYPMDSELRRQLSNVKYKIVNSNGQIKIEAKDDVKKRINRSCDRADCFCYGIWATQWLNPRNQKFKPYKYHEGVKV